MSRPHVTDRVENAPLAQAAIRAVETGEAGSWSDLAEQVFGRRRDSSHLKRLLGLAPVEGKTLSTIPYEKAVLIVQALPNIDPVDVGI